MTWAEEILKQENLYDYAAYRAATPEPIPWVIYARAVQALVWAVEEWPEMPPQEAFEKWVALYGYGSHRKFMPGGAVPAPPSAGQTSCGGCGGGRVR